MHKLLTKAVTHYLTVSIHISAKVITIFFYWSSLYMKQWLIFIDSYRVTSSGAKPIKPLIALKNHSSLGEGKWTNFSYWHSAWYMWWKSKARDALRKPYFDTRQYSGFFDVTDQLSRLTNRRRSVTSTLRGYYRL